MGCTSVEQVFYAMKFGCETPFTQSQVLKLCSHRPQRQLTLMRSICAAARNAVHASQGLAALQEGAPDRAGDESASSSGRHLAHPSTRHRHSSSGSTPTRAGPDAHFTPFGRSGPGINKTTLKRRVVG